MRKKRISLPSGIFWVLLSMLAIGYPSYIALDRLPFLLEGGQRGIYSFFTGIPLAETSGELPTDSLTEQDDLYIFSPDEGAIPYISPVTTREEKENPPSDAEEVKAVTIASKLDPKNNPGLTFDQDVLLQKALSFDRQSQTILIIHSHGSECYSDYKSMFWAENSDVRTTDKNKNVVAVGRVLRDELISLGFRVIHDETLCDQPYNSSYKTALALIEKHMEADSSIGMVLDLHRDSLTGSDGIRYKLVTADGEYTQLMFVVGSNALLSHAGWQDNLAFALQLQKDLMDHHNDLMRPITISKNRYNQHSTPFSLIVECGTEANTLKEAKAGVIFLAQSIHRLFS